MRSETLHSPRQPSNARNPTTPIRRSISGLCRFVTPHRVSSQFSSATRERVLPARIRSAEFRKRTNVDRAKPFLYHERVSNPTTRTQRNWQTGEVFTAADASELYEVERWGKGYFSVSSSGHVLVHPTKDREKSIDLKQLTDHLILRGIQLPVLVRFKDILKHRVGDIHNAFKAAIAPSYYLGSLGDTPMKPYSTKLRA